MPDVSCSGSASARDCTFAGVSMDLFAFAMQFMLDRPVINKTGLDGKYDFHLKFTPADAPASADTSANADAAPNLFT
ncbi:TIGR03435 family protein, partial [Terriglobus sp. ADX1]|uniref:TIGR03435 family protein n=1 Tax=Terriglobus sp. ADX1 TaxID=2794063 RepID=UPI003FCDB3F5